MSERTASSKLDRIPYTPLLHLLALLTTFAVIVADFVITFRNMKINQENWDKFHDFLPFLYLWAAGQFLSKRATAWKPNPESASTETAATVATTVTVQQPARASAANVTRSEAGKSESAGQPAVTAGDAEALGHPTREG